jgi:hypothetical protein
VHLRRALLLFAIVLGLAAIVAAFSRTDRGGNSHRPSPAVEPQVTAPPTPGQRLDVRFSERSRKLERKVPVRTAVEVLVQAKHSGLAAIGGLDQSSAVEPDTPARFEVFQAKPGRFPVSFTPAGRNRSKRLGTLVIVR